MMKKMVSMKRFLLLLALAMIAFTGGVQADLLVYESFDYPTAWRDEVNTFDAFGLTNAHGGGEIGLGGPANDPYLGSTEGWGYYSGLSRHGAVESAGYVAPVPGGTPPLALNVPAGTNYPAPVGNIGISAWGTRVYPRSITSTIDPKEPGTFYSAYLCRQYTGTNNHFDQLQLRGTGLTDLNLGGWGGPGAGYTIMAGPQTSMIVGPAYSMLTDYLFVLKSEFDYDGSDNARFTFWVNPNVAAAEGASTPLGTTTVSYAGTTGTYDKIALYGYTYTAYDEIRIGNAWADLSAVPVPEPSTLVLLFSGVLAVVATLWRRRK